MTPDRDAPGAAQRAWIAHYSPYRPGHCTECAGSRTHLCTEAVRLGRAMRADMHPSESLPTWLTALLDGGSCRFPECIIESTDSCADVYPRLHCAEYDGHGMVNSDH